MMWTVPLIYLAAAVAAGSTPERIPTRTRWSAGAAAAGLATVVALGGVLTQGLSATSVTLVLVSGLAAVVARYCAAYLDGGAGQRRAMVAVAGTVASVSALVVTEHVAGLALCWTASSLCLYPLLTYFERRPGAAHAAHEMFLMARLSDVLVYTGLGGLWFVAGTGSIDGIVQAAAASPSLGWDWELTTLALVVGLAARTAAVPFHGWLMRVMEAPTPVSALLHAGVINIGGYVCIRFGGLLSALELAPWALVGLGGLTVVCAGCTMATRTSIKQQLAWSTSAQMGFMLLECGVGAYRLALLHLVAHSLYKAGAFLGAGRVVEQAVHKRLVAPQARSSRGLGGVGLVAMVAAAGLGLDGLGAVHFDEAGTVGTALLWLAVAVAWPGAAPLLTRGAWLVVGLGFHVLWHHAVAEVVPVAAVRWPLEAALAGVAALLALISVAAEAPAGSLGARWLRERAAVGFRLDRVLSSWLLALWPPRAPETPAPRWEAA